MRAVYIKCCRCGTLLPPDRTATCKCGDVTRYIDVGEPDGVSHDCIAYKATGNYEIIPKD